MSRTGWKSRLLGAALTIGAALQAWSGPAQAQDLSTLVAAKAVTESGRLGALLSERGSVRVIVEVDAQLPAGAMSAGPDGLARVADAVKSAQGAVLAAHVGADSAKADRWAVRQITHFPLMAMTVDRSELEALAADPRVVKIWEDALARPTLTESVPLIGMTSAYTNNADGTNTAVAVLDTGVQSSHPFMAGKVVDEACFSTTNAGQGSVSVCPNGQNSQTGAGAGVNCAAGVSGCDHGTHVAGIAAGKQASGTPPNGVAKEGKIIAVQVFSRFDSAATCSPGPAPCVLSFTSDQIAGLNHVLSKVGVLSQTIASVNMSLGGGQNTSTCDGDSRKSAIDSLRAAGVATAIASGNNGFTNAVGAPGCISTAITVGSTTKADVISSFSNMSDVVDLMAPGSSITSSVPTNVFASFNGTSMATPHVAGAIAALRSRVPAATVDQIETALKTTGTPITDTRSGGTITKPRIRVDLALNQLLGGGGPVLSVTPAANLNAAGPVGGPFSPSSQNYTVQNSGSGTLNWTATSGNPSLATVSPPSGSLGAGASTTVTVSLAAGTSGLAAGSYSTSISFANPPSGLGNTSRTVNLSVGTCTDAFASAPLLSGTTGTITGSNTSATGESGEPNHGGLSTPLNSVWCKFTAGSTGTATFSTSGSSFDTTLTAYTGSAVNALTEIAFNDDFGAGTTSQISFTANAGTTYFIVVDGFSSATGNYTLNYTVPAGGATTNILSAVLPYARSVQVGTPATAFGTILNTSATTATSCSLALPGSPSVPATFSYQTTNASNQLTGTPNTPVSIPGNGAQNFVFGITPTAAFNATDLPIVFDCTNTAPAPSQSGLNTFLMSASVTPVPDMVAVSATVSNNGVLQLPGAAGSGAFSTAAVNIGVAGSITASVDTNGVSLPLALSICQTNPGTGACLAAPTPTVTSTVNATAVATYAIFATATGAITFDPAGKRIFLRLASGGVTRGATSVAVRTDAPPPPLGGAAGSGKQASLSR